MKSLEFSKIPILYFKSYNLCQTFTKLFLTFFAVKKSGIVAFLQLYFIPLTPLSSFLFHLFSSDFYLKLRRVVHSLRSLLLLTQCQTLMCAFCHATNCPTTIFRTCVHTQHTHTHFGRGRSDDESDLKLPPSLFFLLYVLYIIPVTLPT